MKHGHGWILPSEIKIILHFRKVLIIMSVVREVTVKTNNLWNQRETAKITVFTPIYNRRKFLNRVIQSVENQTLREIEYILINDGSTEQIDDVIEDYMQIATIPVMYIKKSNGGVHTARNLGWKNARGGG